MGNGLRTEVRPVWTVPVDDAEALLDAVLASLAVFRQTMPPEGSDEDEAIIFLDKDLRAAVGVRTLAQMKREVRRVSILKRDEGYELSPNRALSRGHWEGISGDVDEFVTDPAELPAMIVRVFNKCE